MSQIHVDLLCKCSNSPSFIRAAVAFMINSDLSSDDTLSGLSDHSDSIAAVIWFPLSHSRGSAERHSNRKSNRIGSIRTASAPALITARA